MSSSRSWLKSVFNVLLMTLVLNLMAISASVLTTKPLFLVINRVSYPYSLNLSIAVAYSLLLLGVLIAISIALKSYRNFFITLSSLSLMLLYRITNLAILTVVVLALCMVLALINRVSWEAFLALAFVSVLQLTPITRMVFGGPAWAALEPVTALLMVSAMLSWALAMPTHRKYSKNIRVSIRLDVVTEFLSLTIIVICCTAMYILPYTRFLNPNMHPVSVDTVFYVKALKEAQTYGIKVFFSKFEFGLDRILYLLILYGASKIFGIMPSIIILAVISHVLLIISVWYLTKALYADQVLALTSSFLAGVSYQTLAFLYGGFNANHLSLPLLYFAYAELVKRKYFRAAVIQGVAAFIHAWSWLQVFTAMILYAIVSARKDSKALAFLAMALITFVIRQLIGSGITKVLSISPAYSYKAYNAVIAKPMLVHTLYAISTFYLWGVMNYPIIYALATIERALNVDPLTMFIAPSSIMMLLSLPSICIVLRILVNTPLYVMSAKFIMQRCKHRWLGLASLILTSIVQYIYFLWNSIPR